MTNKENNIKINNKIENKNNNNIKTSNNKEQKILKLNPKFIKIEKNSINHIESNIKNVIDKSLWIPDNIVDYCYNCDKQFTTILNRKHHCRICGKIFCSNCLNKFLDINIYNEKSEIKVCSVCQQNYRNLITILVNNLVEYKDKENKICFETKLENYIKNNNYQKSIIFDNSENNYDKILNNIYNYLADNIIKKILEDNDISEKYINIIPNIVKKVIENIQPSIEYLQDNININNYIKVKIIKYKNESLCSLIDGYVMQKNVLNKKMKTSFNNPKILILNSGISLLKNNFEEKNNYKDEYYNIISKKILKIKPNIIIIEENIDNKIFEYFEKNKQNEENIIIITDVNKKKLKNIARCVKTFIVPNVDLVDKQIKLGQCENFFIKKLTLENKDNKNNIYNSIISKNEYNLMIFEGCGKILYNSILLSGPDIEELKKIKILLKNSILPTIRDLYLQTFIIKFFNIDILNIAESDEFNINNNFNYIIEQNFYINLNSDDLNKNSEKNIIERDYFNDFKYGFDLEIINFLNQNKNLKTNVLLFNSLNEEYVNTKNEKIEGSLDNNESIYDENISMSSYSTIHQQQLNEIKNIPQNERQIIKSVYHICKFLQMDMKYYSPNIIEEKSLGQLIIDLCKEKEEKCEECHNKMESHSYFLYKNNGCIKISNINSLDRSNEQINTILKYEIGNYLNKEKDEITNNKYDIENVNIISFGFCEICKKIITPTINFSNEIFMFSASKFYKHFFFNHNVKNFEIFQHSKFNIEHEHYSYKNITRFFLTKFGGLKFKFENYIKYNIIEHQLNILDNDSNINNNLIIKKLIITKTKIVSILNDLICLFNFHLDYLENLNLNSKLEDISKKLQNYILNLLKYCNYLNEQKNILCDNNYFNDYLNVDYVIFEFYKIFILLKLQSNKITDILRKLTKEDFYEYIRDILLIKKENDIKEDDNLSDNSSNSINVKNKSFKSNKKDLNISNSFDDEDEDFDNIILKDKNGIILNENIKNNNEKKNNNNDGEINNNNDEEINIKNNEINDNNNDINDINYQKNIENNKNLIFIEDNKIDNNEEKKINNEILKNENEKNKSKKIIESKDEENDNILENVTLNDEQTENNNYKKSINKNTSFNIKQIEEKFKSINKILKKYISTIKGQMDEKIYFKEILESLIYNPLDHNSYYIFGEKNDICSLISYALTSDNYLKIITNIDKIKLYEIDKILNEKNLKNDNNLFKTSLLFDIDKYVYLYNNENDNDKIKKILETEYQCEDNVHFTYQKSFQFNKYINEICKEFKNININNNKENNEKKLNEKSIISDFDLDSLKLNCYKYKETLEDLFKMYKNYKKENKINNNNNPPQFRTSLLNTIALNIRNSFNPSNSNNYNEDNNNLNNKDNLNNKQNTFLSLFNNYNFDDIKKKFKFKKITFIENSLSEQNLKIKIFFPKQFECLRILYCASYKQFLKSIMKSNVWADVSGGKSKAGFSKSFDDKYVIKILSKFEFKMFIDNAENYFLHNYTFLFHNMPSAITKILGAYKIKINNEPSCYCVIMENLFYNLNPEKLLLKTYDLKGSMINRYIKEKKEGKVLLDTNFLEDFKGQPLIVDNYAYNLIISAIKNDTNVFKNNMKVIDYSLLCIIIKDKNKDNEFEQYLNLGILDYFRKYTWDKHLETYGKKLLNFTTKENPTIIKPENYSKRFLRKIEKYFVGF